jgi:large subunit ribosomal protein L35
MTEWYRRVYALPPFNNNNYKITKKMPKVKTNSSAKKRFSFTGTGKIKRHHAFHSHILTKKTKKQKRNLVHDTLVDQTNLKQVRDLLCLR